MYLENKSGRSIVFRPPRIDVAELGAMRIDMKEKSQLSLSNGKQKFQSKGGYLHYRFVGFRKNGKLHGKGVFLFYKLVFHPKIEIEYYKGRYEGSWENDVPQGEGTFYDENGHICVKSIFTNEDIFSGYGFRFQYKGPHVSGKKHGYGTLINVVTKKIIYQGNWRYGQYHGRGTLYQDGDRIYKGEFCQGKFHGNGIMFYPKSYPDLVHKKGKWKHNQFVEGETFYIIGKKEDRVQYHGKGYVDKCNNVVRHGFGSCYDKEGKLSFSGHWLHNRREGLGKSYHKNGNLAYDGFWKGNKKENFGKMYDIDGDLLYDGQWKNNCMHGYGCCYFLFSENTIDIHSISRGRKCLYYAGYLSSNQPHGKGTGFQKDGSISFQANYHKGKKHGKVTTFFDSGSKVDVHYKQDVLHGPAIFYEKDGKTIQKRGKYVKERFVDESFFCIRKFLESKDASHLKKISKNELFHYLEAHFTTSSLSSGLSKKKMIHVLIQAYTAAQNEEAPIERIDDLFGNPVGTPCRGNDGEIYDLTSMIQLFEKNHQGLYKNIPYVYNNNEAVPNYPIMTNGIRLSSYTIILEN